MPQTELMMRLIKEGKIVGHLHIESGDIYITPDKTIDEEAMISGWGHLEDFNIKYDSFELGIKVEVEWWFEGDVIEWEHPDTKSYNIATNEYEEYIISEGIIGYDSKWHEFVIVDKNGELNWFFYNQEGRNLWHWFDFNKLGTIHDEVTDETGD